MSGASDRPVALWILPGVVAGAAVGAALAYFMLRGDGAGLAMPEGAVASVNTVPVQLQDYQHRVREGQLAKVAAEDVLAAMLDEQLLAQYAARSGLIHRDASLVAMLRESAAVAAGADADAQPPSESQLKDFYAQHGAMFREPGRVAVERMVFRGANAQEQAEHAYAQLEAGGEFSVIRAQFANPDLLGLPNQLLEAQRLVDFLGKELTEAVVNLPRGGYTRPLAPGHSAEYVILGVSDNRPPRKPPLATVRDEVTRAFEQFRKAEAVELLLRELRAAAEMKIDESRIGPEQP